MSHTITIVASLFDPDTDRVYSERAILSLLYGLVGVNREYLRRYQTLPLYRAGVKYIREEGSEHWLAIPDIIKNGGGDCEDLACWRVAELLEVGVNAKPFLRWRKHGGSFYLYHVLVKKMVGGKEIIEDPSRILGMGKEE